MSIPDSWTYETRKTGWFFLKKERIPYGWIVEGTNSVQCLCPNCEYAEGYNQPCGPWGTQKDVICPTCGTKFIALVL